jgi:hypothetical protein
MTIPPPPPPVRDHGSSSSISSSVGPRYRGLERGFSVCYDRRLGRPTERGGWGGAMKSFSQDEPQSSNLLMAANGKLKSFSTEEAGRGTHRVRMRSYRR